MICPVSVPFVLPEVCGEMHELLQKGSRDEL